MINKLNALETVATQTPNLKFARDMFFFSYLRLRDTHSQSIKRHTLNHIVSTCYHQLDLTSNANSPVCTLNFGGDCDYCMQRGCNDFHSTKRY